MLEVILEEINKFLLEISETQERSGPKWIKLFKDVEVKFKKKTQTKEIKSLGTQTRTSETNLTNRIQEM